MYKIKFKKIKKSEISKIQLNIYIYIIYFRMIKQKNNLNKKYPKS